METLWKWWYSASTEEQKDLEESECGSYEVVVSPEERAKHDRLHVTPGKSSFRAPRQEDEEMKVQCNGNSMDIACQDDSESDEEEFIGINRTPPHKSPQKENKPMNLRSFDSTKREERGFRKKISFQIQEDESMEVVDGLSHDKVPRPFPASYATSYVEPPVDVLMQQLQVGMFGKKKTGGLNNFLGKIENKERNANESIAVSGFNEKDETKIEHQKTLENMNMKYQKELSLLRSEQRKRQELQQKEFEDSEKYIHLCEQYRKDLTAAADELDRNIGKLEVARKNIQNLQNMMREVYYDQVDEGTKVSLEEKVKKAENDIAESEDEIKNIDMFVSKHADGESWLDTYKFKTLFDSDIVRGLIAGQNHEMLFFNKLLITLKQLEALVPSEQLDKECMTFLRDKNISNCVTYLELRKNEMFRNILALDPRMDMISLRSRLSEIRPAVDEMSFGKLSTAVEKKIAQIEKQTEIIQKIIDNISEARQLDEAWDNLRENLEDSDVQQLREYGSEDVLFFDLLLKELEKLQNNPNADTPNKVVKFLNETNKKLLGDVDSSRKIAEITPETETNSVPGDDDILLSKFDDIKVSIEKILCEIPEQYRSLYQKCLTNCVELAEKLKSLTSNDGDMRNERRKAICQSVLYFNFCIDEVTSKDVKRRLLSHLFQTIISLAAVEDMLTILELSIIPSYLCRGNIENSRIFYGVVHKGAPVCTPRLDVTSQYFESAQRVRIVGLYAAQIAYCMDLNSLIGFSVNGLENCLEMLWGWIVSCGSAISHFVKGNASANLGEMCDSIKLFLSIAGFAMMNFIGARFKQLLIGPLRGVLKGVDDRKAKQLLSLLDNLAQSNTLSCVLDLHMLTPFSCLARVKICDWETKSQEWEKVTVSHKKELSEVKRIVGRSFNLICDDDDALRNFQENMSTLATLPEMQNSDLRGKILFFLSEKALSRCSLNRSSRGGINEDELVAPLATFVMYLLTSQRGMSEVFFMGLCSYCPFVYHMPLAVSEDDTVNKLEQGYSKVELSKGSSNPVEMASKWKFRMTSLLALYALLIVRGSAFVERGGSSVKYFTLQDGWGWISRTVNFCLRNGEEGLPPYTVWMLFTFINIVNAVFLNSSYRDHYLQLLVMIKTDILPSIRGAIAEDKELLDVRISKILG